MRTKAALLLTLAGSASLPRLAGEVRGPIAGVVLDTRSQALRPILGIPGAAVLGPALDAGFPVRVAELADRGRFALAAGDGGLAVVTGLAEDRPAARQVEGGAAADLLALNAEASAAAAYSRAASRIQVIRGLPERPAVAAEFNLSSLGEVRAVALDNLGTTLLVCVTGSGVYRLRTANPDAPPELVASSPDPVAVALAGDRDAVFADYSGNSITKLTDFRGLAFPVLLAGAGEGIRGPAGLAVNGSEVLVANSDASTVTFIRLEGGFSGSVELIARPTRCSRLAGESLYVLNDAGPAPLLLIDAAATRNVYFVPAD